MTIHTRMAQEVVNKATRKGLQLAGEHLLGAARELVPIEEGDLSRSGRVSTVSPFHVAVGFGGRGLDDYAVRQHEELGWRHAPGRQAKYLEQPFTTEAATMHAIIGESIRKDIGR